MGKIVILDENTSNKIAAGEVVERPASVIKELMENSIDAGASTITVDIKSGGISYIKVTDNGSGIDEDDVEIAFERHATSKIRNANDLESVSTMGFRGEALASIASVASVELTTRVQKNPHGTYIKIQGGVVKEVRQTGCPVGTTFVVRDLFFNTPARFKFLKKDSTEAGYISDIITRLALANPQISFRLTSGGSSVIHTPGNNDMLSVIYSIYGKEVTKGLAEVSHSDNKINIGGYVGKPEIARGNRNHQSIFINGRYIKSRVITSAVDEAYKTFLMKNKFPFIVLNIMVNPLLVDVNVHPTKMEVRFSEEQEIFRAVYHAVTNALLSKPLVREVNFEGKKENPFKYKEYAPPKESFTQQNLELEKLFATAIPRKEHYSDKINKVNNLPKKEDNIKGAIHEPETNIEHEVNIVFQKDGGCKPTGVFESELSVKSEASGKEDAAENFSNSTDDSEAEKVYEESTEIAEVNRVCDHSEVYAGAENLALMDARIIGQAFSTYILLQHADELLLIDQHAAHERIMYEDLKSKYMNNESLSQQLISPVVIELTHREIKLLEEEREFFNKIGFIYDSFGNNSIILRSVPYYDTTNDVKQMFTDVIDFISNSAGNDYRRIADEALYSLACKSAIKANKRLDDMEINNLIKELAALENPYSCPHGRPTVIKISEYELEKKFKRIV